MLYIINKYSIFVENIQQLNMKPTFIGNTQTLMNKRFSCGLHPTLIKILLG